RFFPHNSIYSPGWPRAYALATEPGILAHYFNTLGPLALWQLWRYRFLSAILKSGLTLLVITAWVFTFSAAGFAFMFIGVIVVGFIRLIDESSEFRRMGFSPRCLTDHFSPARNIRLGPYEKPVRVAGAAVSSKKAAPGIIILLGLVVLFVVLVFWNSKYSLSFQEASEPVHAKVSLRDSSSVSDRLSRWETALAGIAEKPIFGNGIGCLGSRQEGSSTSWFLFLALESGIPAMILFVLFLVFSFRRIWKSQQPYRYWFLAGFLASVLHFNVVSTIHHPFLWVLLALFHVAESQKSLPMHNNMYRRRLACNY
ncbi:MAG: O-antigen ligase family protein, partial [Sedimentisphaerales bacterium]|nr:O-antigen ligase family protein [Sedimentisphaerales bacterium]